MGPPDLRQAGGRIERVPIRDGARISERWARAFEGIYQEAPRWYLSDGGADTFRPAAFHHSLDHRPRLPVHGDVLTPPEQRVGLPGRGRGGELVIRESSISLSFP